jgi:hypothetical protein
VTEVHDLIAAGWTQGSVLLVDEHLTPVDLRQGDRYMVISHPCEVASPSFERDPFVEILQVADQDAIDGNLTFGKNPRRLQLVVDSKVLEISFAQRVTIDRKVLADRVPDQTVAEDDRRVLAAWLASRYARPAFADEFNRRLLPATRRLEKILKTAGSRISAIYVATTLSELELGVDYEVRMVFTMLSDDFANGRLFTDVSEAVDEISSAISALEGLDLVSIRVMSEEDVSIDALRTYARWDYDSLSFKEGESAVLPAQA